MQIAPTSTGEVQIGNATLPAFAAIDIAQRILEAAQSTSLAIEGRRRVRLHLDRMFVDARPIRARWLADKSYFGCIGYVECNRLHLRISDSATACLIPDGGRAHGMVMRWRDDSLFGPIAETDPGFLRVSAGWFQSNVLEVVNG